MNIEAVYIADSIQLKSVISTHKASIQTRSPLLLKYSGKHVVVYTFGVIVFFDCTTEEQTAFIESITSCMQNVFTTPLREIEQLQIGTEFDCADHTLTVPTLTVKTMAVISLVLARSLALEQQEHVIQTQLAAFSNLHINDLGTKKSRLTSKKLLQMAGESMRMRQHMTLSMSMLDTPDIIWNNSELANFHSLLLHEYEVSIRFKQTMQKSQLLIEHVEFILHVIENRRALWLEVTIVILILIEIILFVYEIFGH